MKKQKYNQTTPKWFKTKPNVIPCKIFSNLLCDNIYEYKVYNYYSDQNFFYRYYSYENNLHNDVVKMNLDYGSHIGIFLLTYNITCNGRDHYAHVHMHPHVTF